MSMGGVPEGRRQGRTAVVRGRVSLKTRPTTRSRSARMCCPLAGSEASAPSVLVLALLVLAGRLARPGGAWEYPPDVVLRCR